MKNTAMHFHRAGRRLLAALALLLTAAVAMSQYWGEGRRSIDTDVYRTARDIPSHSTGTPVWTNLTGFEKDVFTFVRLKYGRNPYRRTRGAGWTTDLPDSDLNLSFRLQQMTAMKVDPDGRLLKLTDKDLGDYPFLYIVEPGGLYFTDDEVLALRNHLLNGGFLMLDDFWGEAEWANMEGELKRVFPDRSFSELPLDHPIYHCVFEIKSKGQVPNIQLGIESEFAGVTWERPDATVVHHRVIKDDRGRIMVIATHNTDNGDGWEREGENDYYFHNFSEKISYPLGINILFYTMTH
jgi:hypothetical protein